MQIRLIQYIELNGVVFAYVFKGLMEWKTECHLKARVMNLNSSLNSCNRVCGRKTRKQVLRTNIMLVHVFQKNWQFHPAVSIFNKIITIRLPAKSARFCASSAYRKIFYFLHGFQWKMNSEAFSGQARTLF